MVDMIVYKPSPYGLVIIHDKPLELRLGFIIYHIKHERVYVFYIIRKWTVCLPSYMSSVLSRVYQVFFPKEKV